MIIIHRDCGRFQEEEHKTRMDTGGRYANFQICPQITARYRSIMRAQFLILSKNGACVGQKTLLYSHNFQLIN